MLQWQPTALVAFDLYGSNVDGYSDGAQLHQISAYIVCLIGHGSSLRNVAYTVTGADTQTQKVPRKHRTFYKGADKSLSLYLFLFVTSVRTTATEWKLNCSK